MPEQSIEIDIAAAASIHEPRTNIPAKNLKVLDSCKENMSWYLVTGGSGFIASHTARRLHKLGYHVRIVDILKPSLQDGIYYSEFVQGNLCDPVVCARALHGGVCTVLHFAANMGGMGVIHDGNGSKLYRENSTMTWNLLEASVSAGVKTFFYASTACVYPVHLQNTKQKGSEKFSLRENDIFAGGKVNPQGLYGTEKLVGEILLQQYSDKLGVRIARFHNVYGPGTAWEGGREKAPAALARKAVLAKRSLTECYTFEIWGDGTQYRSFLYIDDCVEAILLLLKSQYYEPLNIGSEDTISVKDLAILALKIVNVNEGQVRFIYDRNKPIGVQSRSSNNERVSDVLKWQPRTSLEEGMKQTINWITQQMDQIYSSEQISFLHGEALNTSKLLQLEQSCITFGIILPMTSRGMEKPSDCLQLLDKFAKSLAKTTWQDIYSLQKTDSYRIKIYLAFDHDDDFFSNNSQLAEDILVFYGFTNVTSKVYYFPRGYVCHLWRACAQQAWEDGCDYMILFGDDVELLDVGWLHQVHKAFEEKARYSKLPHGLACIAFTDISFPGMPTFPVIHRTHIDIFGQIFPEVFINQDADPFLFQLYRRFGTSMMLSYRIRNGIGGPTEARYIKQTSPDWTFSVLDKATSKIDNWLIQQEIVHNPRKLTLDIIIPSFRVEIPLLSRILNLRSSETCEVMFIIIVDDPQSKNIHELTQKFDFRPDVRIRVNSITQGASASRNRGIQESAAEWIHFLDDDVVPIEDLLLQDEKIIRAWPNAAGFVGKTQFPPADTIYKSAVHMAGVTYFWDIADKISFDIPWGVTANLLVKRDMDSIQYDLRFPKTGGGEDIDYCIRKRNYSVKHGKDGFIAAPDSIVTHPWWNNGERSYYMRFFGWAHGDGALVQMFPEHCYTDYAPTSAQAFLLYISIMLGGICFMQVHWIRLGFLGITATFLANLVHDYYRIICHEGLESDSRLTIGMYQKMAAIPESSIIRMMSEAGRLYGQIERGELRLQVLFRRFDWFTGCRGRIPIDIDRKNSRERLILSVLILGGLLSI